MTSKLLSSSVKTTKINDLEEQIRLLESALEQDDDDDDEDNDGESEDEDNGLLVECDEAGNVVRFVSSLVTEKIAPLPASLLPLPMCSRGGGGSNRPKPSSSSSSRMDGKGNGVRFADESIDATRSERPPLKKLKKSSSDTSSSSKPLSGLESTVMELLANYQVRSGEGRPFWCRICRTQSADMDDYNAHMLSEFHRTAAKMERKLSFCKLCKKQFNSPDQLQEHVSGKAHKEFLANRMSKQTNGKSKFS